MCHGRSRTFSKNLSVIGRLQAAQGSVPTPGGPTPIAAAATAAENSADEWSVDAPSTPPSLAAKWFDNTGVVSKGSAVVSSARWCPLPLKTPSEPGRAAVDNVTAVVRQWNGGLQ